MIINLADNFLASLDDDVSCPSATINSSINYANRQNAIEISNYGPLNTAVQNPDYWELVSSNLNVPVNILRKRLCNNCFYFNASIELEACIVNGDNAIDEYATRESGDVGFCELWDFKASEYRRCNVWSLKNIAQETNDLEQYKMAVNQPRVPKGSSAGGQFGATSGSGAGGEEGNAVTSAPASQTSASGATSFADLKARYEAEAPEVTTGGYFSDTYKEPITVTDVTLEVYRVGSAADSSRGIFFASDKAGADSYEVLHEGSVTKKYMVTVDKVLVAGHQNTVTQFLFKKTYQDLQYDMQRRYGSEGADVANRAFDKKIMVAAKKLGFKGIVYTRPAPPAKAELHLFSSKGLLEIKMAANQPRVPKGSSSGGQFGSNRGGAGGGITGASRTFAAGQDEKINDTLKQEQGAYIDTLSKDQMRSVSDYQQIETYEEVNGALRNSTSLSPENQTLVTNLDSAIAGSGMEIKTTVYRGLVDDNGSLERLKVGDTMLEKGYSSTSPNPAVAEAFANSAYSPEGKPYVLQIEVPAKHPAIAADVVGNKLSGTDLIQTDPMTVELTGYTRLNEVTLPRNLSMAVKEITVKENATYITVSITK